MRTARIKVERSAYYHVTSRAIEGRAVFDALAAETFVGMMRAVEEFSGVEVVTYCVMSNHVHLLLRVPDRKKLGDSELLERLALVSSAAAIRAFREKWKRMDEQGSAAGLEELRQGVLRRMHDLSFFMKALKQRFSEWHNRREKRKGPVWEDRFKSSLIEGKPGYLAAAAAYIDNNPVRAGMVSDPRAHRFCGYAAALAGDARALAGLAILTQAYGITGDASRVLGRYRLLLFGRGLAREDRAGCSRAEMEAVFAQNGELRPWELAKHRLRWWSDGAVIGSRAFVQELNARFREKLRLRRPPSAHPVEPESSLCTLRVPRPV